MNTIDLQTASSEIKQACEDNERGRLPYFFLVGAGLSSPTVRLASEIEEDCKGIAHKYGRMGGPPTNDPIDTYSHWFDKAYPQPIQRQKYLRSLIGGKTISPANFRLAHLLLQRNIASLVVTPNFDDFLSRALTLFGKQHVVCDHPSTVDRIDPEERDDIQIVHVHGSYWFYDCCNLRCEIAGRAQASQSTLSMPALLENILWRRMPLVIGYSGWEGDVMMEALQRRLKNPLPNRLYWFCYRRDAIELLPEWLKSHENVYFVVPPKPDPDSSEGSNEVEPGGQSRTRTPPQSDVNNKVIKGSEEPTMPAQQVLDKLIQTFSLCAPMLTSDPLGYFANYLRSSLPEEDSKRSGDLYFIKSVVERIERARQKEEEESNALRIIETGLEKIRDALRRSQYREAITEAHLMQFKDMTPTQLLELLDATRSATTLLNDNSAEALRGYNLIYDLCETLLDNKSQQGFNRPDVNEATLTARAARALLNKGITLGALGQRDEEIAAYEKVVARFGGVEESEICKIVADALINKGIALGELNRGHEELVTYDEIVRRYGGPMEPVLREQVLIALFNKAIGLSNALRFEEAIAVCDEMVARGGDGDSPSLRESMAAAMVNKAFYLSKLNKYDEAVATCNEVVRRFEASSEGTLPEQVAKALLNKGNALAALNRIEDAIRADEELERRFGDATDAALREQVAKALFNNGVWLVKLERHEEALRAWIEVIRRCGDATEFALREVGASAMVQKALQLSKLSRTEETISTLETVVKRFGDATEVSLRGFVADAQNGIGFETLSEAKLALSKGDDALGHELLLKAEARFKLALKDKPDNPIIIANQGYAAFLLGERDRAHTLLSRSIERGGREILEGELKDADIHPLPQDEEFRTLLRSIPVPAPIPS